MLHFLHKGPPRHMYQSLQSGRVKGHVCSARVPRFLVLRPVNKLVTVPPACV